MSKLEDVILRDITGNRPAAGVAGRLFFDTTLVKMQRDTGAAWEDVAEVGGGGGGYTEGARVYNSGNISINDITETTLTFDTERYDTDAIHDLVVNPGRLTCKTSGKYAIKGSVAFDSDAVGNRYITIKLNGTNHIAFHYHEASSSVDALTIATDWDLSVNDYVELIVFQSSGGALNVEASPDYSPEFMMERIG